MLEALFEILFSFVMELVVEIVGEVLIELGFHATAEKLSSKARSRVILGGAYAIFGAVLGFLSLYIFPKIVFANRLLPILYFIVSPIIAGFSLTFVSWLINRGIRPVRLFEFDKFAFGVLFALAYSLSRVIFG
jgi:hypothetical protein